MGEFANDALNQSMDEWLGAMEDPEDNEYWVGYRSYSRGRSLKPSGPGSCPSCGADTVLRNGKFGQFYGCSKYPNCKGNRKF
jgi:hypothetical protein